LPPFIYFSTSYPELGSVVCDSHSSRSVRTSISPADLSLFRTRESTCFTERYLGCAQRISSAVNDRIGIEPAP
jgi:hypothetical protein